MPSWTQTLYLQGTFGISGHVSQNTRGGGEGVGDHQLGLREYHHSNVGKRHTCVYSSITVKTIYSSMRTQIQWYVGQRYLDRSETIDLVVSCPPTANVRLYMHTNFQSQF